MAVALIVHAIKKQTGYIDRGLKPKTYQAPALILSKHGSSVAVNQPIADQNSLLSKNSLVLIRK